MTHEENTSVLLHQAFAETLETLLEPLGIEVQAEVEVSKQPLKVDIILIRRTGAIWTPQQLEVLCDGIRESSASHILVEFKNTESFDRKAVKGIITYEHSFQTTKELPDEDIQCFIVVAHAPQQATREKFRYTIRVTPGVYHSTCCLLADTPLIVLSELRTTTNNMFFKVFAHNRRAKLEAVQQIYSNDHTILTNNDNVRNVIFGLMPLWDNTEEYSAMRITKEFLMEQGKAVQRRLAGELLGTEILDMIQDQEFFQKLQQDLILKSHLEGKQEGLKEGKQEGKQEGLILGQQQSLLVILQNRFGAISPFVEAALANATADQLSMLIPIALQATTMDEFEDHLTRM